jgi:type IV secretion system protein VirB1
MAFNLSMGALTLLLSACAPQVAPETGLRLVQHESLRNPYAIAVNGPYVVRPQPSTAAQAVATGRMLLGLPGVRSIDVGLGMINSSHLPRLGLSLEQVFEPCTNLQVMQSVLLPSYERAVRVHGPGQQALQRALSEYNTGHPSRGIANGYVRKVYLQPVP